MTVRIAPGSSRAVAARRFADELKRAMSARKVSTQRLAEASGCMKSSIATWRSAYNIPMPATAARLAEALDWPKLLEVSIDARRKTCPRCGSSFVDATGAGNRQFCSSDCRLVDAQLRKPTAAAELHDTVRAAADARLAGAPERETLPAILAAIREYETSSRRHRDRVDAQERRLRAVVAGVDAMCRSCEPEGLCRTAECPLRPFSPLPMASGRPVSAVRAPGSPHDPEHREQWLAATRAGSQRRWQRPGERERMAEAMTARHASMTPEQREERARRISDGRRRAIA